MTLTEGTLVTQQMINMRAIQVFLRGNYILSFILIVFMLNSNAQSKWDTKEKTYSNGVFLQGLVSLEKNELISLIPQGKNVSVTYDPYFNTYKIKWDESDNQAQLILSPGRETASNGTVFTDTYPPDKDKRVEYFIIDEIVKEKRLRLIMANPTDYEGKKYKFVLNFIDLN